MSGSSEHTTEHATTDGHIITITNGKVVSGRPMTAAELKEFDEYRKKLNKRGGPW